MRIAILGSRGIPAKYGAFETFSEKLGVGLVERGHKVTVSCPYYQDYKKISYKGIDLMFCSHPKGPIGSLIYDGIALWKSSRDKQSVILMLGYASSILCIIPLIFKRKIVINTNGLEWRRSKWPWYGKLWLRFSEKIAVLIASELVSDSKTIAHYYKEQYGVDSNFIPYGTEIYNKLDSSSALQEYHLQPNMYYVVVMRMEPENSIKQIVEGFLKAETQRPLILVGPSTPFFDANVRTLFEKANKKIRYIGTIYDREKLFQIRQNAYAYIHGHTVGGTNPSLLEAMAAKNLVIARDVGFNREVLENIGFYFNSAEDLPSVIEGLERCSDEELENKKYAAKELIQKSYTWPIIIEAYERLFSSICQ